MTKIKFQKIHQDAIIPRFAKEGDAGLDLSSVEDYEINPGDHKLVKTGLKMDMPDNHVGLIWDRSGLAYKNAIHIMAGVIDSHYRGEVRIVVKNLGKEIFKVEKGMRIAQILIQPVANNFPIEEVQELDETERGENNFGSTGL